MGRLNIGFIPKPRKRETETMSKKVKTKRSPRITKLDLFNQSMKRFNISGHGGGRDRYFEVIDLENGSKPCIENIAGFALARTLCIKCEFGYTDPYNPTYVTKYWDDEKTAIEN